MKRYQEIQKKTESAGNMIAAALTVAFHAAIVVFGVCTGLKYIYPPPPEQSFVIDFTQEDEKIPVQQQKRGSAPHTEVPDRKENIKLIQKSEGQEKGKTANKAQESTMDDFGDVEKYEPKRERPIEKRALFHAANNRTDKDTLAAQTAEKISERLKEGHAQGNTKQSNATGEPNAHLKGRKTVGVIAKPEYSVQEAGTVVVTIWVDQYGTVTKAIPGDPGTPGTTVNNSALWNAARKAALKTHFNMDGDAPALQKGTITYIFKLTKD